MKDYYKDLKISSKCSYEDIAQAFRFLSTKNPSAQSLYALCEAYEVLSDPHKRKIYDQYGEYILKEGLPTLHPIGGYRFVGDISKTLLNFYGTLNPLKPLVQNTLNATQDPAPEDITIELNCTLEEMYNGCRKNIQYAKSGRNLWKVIEILPGCPVDYKFVYYGEGQESETHPSSNLIFIVKEIKHKFYTRIGNDLVYHARISLLQSLCGSSIEIVKNI
jgi:DnaJ-class molecular chaperone